MVSKFHFLIFLSIIIPIIRSGSGYYGEEDEELTNCTNVLIRKFGSGVNYHLEFIRAISKCPSDSDSNPTIKQKCEIEPSDEAILEDIFLFTLALDLATKTVLYSNVYCAICNDEKEFYQFPPYFYYQLDEAGSTAMSIVEDRKHYPISEHSFLLSKLKKNEKTVGLISYNQYGTRYKFKPYKVLIVPKRSKKIFSEPMLPFRPPLLPFCSESPQENFRCDDTSNSSKIDKCFYLDDQYSNIFNSREVIQLLNENRGRPQNATFCPQRYIDLGGESSYCKYEDDDGYVCWWNKFLLKGVDYTEGDNGEIFFVDNYTMINISRDEYSLQTGLKDVIYLCGVNQRKGRESQYCIEVMNSIQTLLRRVSIFCVIVYLLIHSRRKVLSHLIAKITYSYYVTLLLMYLREELSDGLKSRNCFLEYAAYRYLLQSYTFWISISSWYIWMIIRSPETEISSNENVITRRKIYLSMCFIGWILPALFFLSFYLIEPKPSCPVIATYRNLKLCKPSDEPDVYFWFIFVSIFIICTVVLAQFLTSCYRYQFGKKRAPGERHIDWRSRMLFFFKIVYSMVLYVMLSIASIVDRKGPAYGILLHLWSFHGTLIFFLYSFKTAVLKRMFIKHTISEVVSTSDEMSKRKGEPSRGDDLDEGV